VRVPILFRGPGVPAGQRRKQLVGLQDIPVTLAAAAGCPLPGDVHGVDLAGALADGSTPVRDLYYAQCMDAPRQAAMVTDGRWKYCWAQEGPTEELYDLKTDPTELVNLATCDDAETQLAPWREKLIAEATKIGDTAILDGDRLASTPFDRSTLKDLPVAGMGWRWF
jgi:arylsulfatase A-like enzyme